MAERIAESPLHTAAETRYLSYALSVITSRALPDVRDGLKPVQRRILYAMFANLRLLPDAKPKKSAAVVGEVMAKYHPHGDQSIYDAMVRLAQDFSLRYPLVDGHGNFGSLDGDRAAAMRYTEAKLRHVATELLDEIKKGTVDWRPNYDGSISEPVVLPAQVPNLLINGAVGIAVGMATSIPPHNLGEVVDALVHLIDGNPTLEELVTDVIQGPDFPTGGEILNTREELLEIYRNGRGAIEMQGEYELEEDGRRKLIVVTSVPYMLDKSALIGEIADHIRAGRVPQLIDIRDESTEEIRVVLELKRGADPEAAMAYLYKRTSLRGRFNVNLTALVPTDDPQICRPERLDLLSILRYFLDFRHEVTQRRLQHDLSELERRIHLLQAFALIFDGLDEAIALIRASDGKADARSRLMVRFGLDEEQAEAILETKLYRLARLEIDAIRQELSEKEAQAAEIRTLLGSEVQMWALIRKELVEIRELYGDPRRSRVNGPKPQVNFSVEDYIIAEDSFVIVTRGGWFKRQKSYTDLSAIRVREGDEIGWVLPASARESLILFSDRGKAYTLRVADVQQTTGYGEAIQTRFGFVDGETIIGAWTSDPRVQPAVSEALLASIEADDPKPPYAVALTRAGRCMRFNLEAFAEPSTVAGRIFMRLEATRKDDAVVQVEITEGHEFVSLATRQGRCLIFPVSDVKVLAGAGKGVLAIKLGKDDLVLAFALPTDKMDGLEVQTNKGRREVIRPNKYKVASRAGKGRVLIDRGYIAKAFRPPLEVRLPAAEIDVVDEDLVLPDEAGVAADSSADELATVFADSAESAAESLAESLADSVADSVAESAAESLAELLADSAAESVAESAAEAEVAGASAPASAPDHVDESVAPTETAPTRRSSLVSVSGRVSVVVDDEDGVLVPTDEPGEARPSDDESVVEVDLTQGKSPSAKDRDDDPLALLKRGRIARTGPSRRKASDDEPNQGELF